MKNCLKGDDESRFGLIFSKLHATRTPLLIFMTATSAKSRFAVHNYLRAQRPLINQGKLCESRLITHKMNCRNRFSWSPTKARPSGHHSYVMGLSGNCHAVVLLNYGVSHTCSY